jgi:hypothetical protein
MWAWMTGKFLAAIQCTHIKEHTFLLSGKARFGRSPACAWQLINQRNLFVYLLFDKLLPGMSFTQLLAMPEIFFVGHANLTQKDWRISASYFPSQNSGF